MAKSGLTAILSELDAVPPPPTTPEEKEKARFRAMSQDEKMRQAFTWRMRGVPVQAIANAFGVDPRTIYRWIQTLRAQFREQFEGETAADNLAGHLMALEQYEEMCLYEASQLGKDGKSFDPVSGSVVESKNAQQSIGNKAKFLKLGLDCRQAQIQLLLETGIIPRNEPNRMYSTLEREGRIEKANEQEDQSVPQDRKQLIGSLIKKLERQQTL